MQKINSWSVPRSLTGNVFVYGRVGGGKSCKLLTLAQGLHSKGFKIWDMFGGKREEGPFWCFPNDDLKIWKQIEDETMEFKNDGPKQYKVKLLYPLFKGKLPKTLPYSPPNVKSQVFTIPFRDIPDDMEQLIATVIGALGSQSTRLFHKILDNTDRNSNLADIEYLFGKKLKAKKNDKLYDSFFKPMIKQGLLSSEKATTNIDFVSESRDKETICVLCLDYVPVRFRYFVMGYLLKKIFNLVKMNKTHKNNFALFREASLFMKVVDSDKNVEEATSIFRNLIVDIARYCRSGLFLGMDTQDSSEVKGMIEGSDDLLLICEMPSQKSREVTCEPLKRDGRMSDKQIAYLGWKIQIQEVCVVERGKKAKILKRINPPRCRYWKSQDGDFNSLWRKEVNEYRATVEFYRDYEEEVRKRKELMFARQYEEEKEEKPEKKEEPIVEVEIKQEPEKVVTPGYIKYDSSRFE